VVFLAPARIAIGCARELSAGVSSVLMVPERSFVR
jgi:hypothetical protein